MKYFIVADVHGFYNEMIEALNKKGFDKDNPEHIFVSLGDLLDRGEHPLECLEFVMSIPKERRILIMGNHELLMRDMINKGEVSIQDMHNGTFMSAVLLTGESDIPKIIDKMKSLNIWWEYFNECVFYKEIVDNLFVHGWIPCFTKGKYTVNPIAYNLNWRDASIKEWEDAVWINGMKAWDNGIREYGKTIWCGHWHTSWGHSHLHNYGVEFAKKNTGILECFEPFKDEGIVAMDACTVHSHFVNCEVITI